MATPRWNWRMLEPQKQEKETRLEGLLCLFGQPSERIEVRLFTLEEKSQLETHRVEVGFEVSAPCRPPQACCFCPADACFLLAGAFGMQVWHFPTVETID